MKKLLLIAYYFPPDGGGGTQRPAKFCRYLPELGWQVTVVTRTVRDESSRGRWDPADESMLQEVEPAAQIIRVAESPRDGEGEWPADLMKSDPEASWMSPVYRSARHAIDNGEADAVMITMSPFWLNHLGRRLQSVTGVPVIYDLRDPWALDGWQPMRTRWHWLNEMQLMRLTLESAAGVIANTPEAGNRMLENFPSVKCEKMEVITNGYDAADFPRSQRIESNHRDEFMLVHTGTLYGHVLLQPSALKSAIKKLVNYSPERIEPSGRTILHLLAAMKRVNRKLRLVLVGKIDEGTKKCIDNSGLRDSVTCTGYVSHAESVGWLLKADGLFLPLHDLPDGERSLIVPGKTYEYLAAGKPILGCLPPGDARDLVEKSGVGYFARPTDELAIASALEKMLDDWSAGREKHSRAADWIANFERRALTQKLARFLNRVVASKKAGKRESMIAS